MHSSVAPKRVLYIEDDERLTGSFKAFVKKKLGSLPGNLQLEISAARHVREADETLRRKQCDALVVDLMLPADEFDLAELKRLERKRTKLVRELVKWTDYDADFVDDQTARLRKQIDDLNVEIERHIRMEGGCEVLEQYARELSGAGPGDDLKPLELPVVFVSARGLPEVRKRCQKIVLPRFFRWLGKPVEEMDVLNALLSFFEVS